MFSGSNEGEYVSLITSFGPGLAHVGAVTPTVTHTDSFTTLVNARDLYARRSGVMIGEPGAIVSPHGLASPSRRNWLACESRSPLGAPARPNPSVANCPAIAFGAATARITAVAARGSPHRAMDAIQTTTAQRPCQLLGTTAGAFQTPLAAASRA